MYLKKINIEEFKTDLYPEYEKIFPQKERKTYEDLKNSYNHDITEIIEIISENQVVGFFIINRLKNSLYIHLDYFAILPNNQGKGYGTSAIKLLKKTYSNCDGIFIEIEKIGHGENEEENKIRQRRAKFYEKLGFSKMGFELELYTIIYSTYILPCREEHFIDQKVIENILNIYTEIFGKEKVQKYCKIIL